MLCGNRLTSWTEPRERRRQVALVEPPDRRRDLRLVVFWMHSRCARVQPLRGVLVAGLLRRDALPQERRDDGAARLEDRVPLVEELRVQDRVGADLVERVAAARLRRDERLARVRQIAGAVERQGVVELHDRVARRLLRERLDRLRRPPAGERECVPDRGGMRRGDARNEVRLAWRTGSGLGLRRIRARDPHDADHDCRCGSRGEPGDDAHANPGRHGATVDDGQRE